MKKFIKRKDLSAEIRMEIAIRAYRAKGVYGAITEISRTFACCRLFVYQQLWTLLTITELAFTDVSKPDHTGQEEMWKRLVLLIRLENRASVKSLSRTLTYLNFDNHSVGTISQTLKKWGSSLSSTLQSDTCRVLLICADEIYAGGSPILISLDPASMAILKMELAEDCTAERWRKHWNELSQRNFIIKGVTSDRGKGLMGGAKLLELEWFTDQFHEFRTLVRLIHRGIYKRAEHAMANVLRMPSRDNKEIEEEKIYQYDAHQYLLDVLFQSLPFLDKQGTFRTQDWVQKEVTAVLQLMTELGDKEVAGRACKLLKRLPEILLYMEKADELHSELINRGVEPGIIQGFCMVWYHIKGMTNQRGNARRYHRQERRTWEQLLKSELGREYESVANFILIRLDTIPRTSSLVESVNSQIRPYLNSCKGKITQEMLNLIMFYHNYHPFNGGKRKGKSPIELLTGKPPEKNWYELLLDKVS